MKNALKTGITKTDIGHTQLKVPEYFVQHDNYGMKNISHNESKGILYERYETRRDHHNRQQIYIT